MKHYTSTELIARMEKIGYWYNADASYRGYIVFHGTEDGFSFYPLTFSSWKDVAEWYTCQIENM